MVGAAVDDMKEVSLVGGAMLFSHFVDPLITE
jgi:hypothetical protein